MALLLLRSRVAVSRAIVAGDSPAVPFASAQSASGTCVSRHVRLRIRIPTLVKTCLARRLPCGRRTTQSSEHSRCLLSKTNRKASIALGRARASGARKTAKPMPDSPARADAREEFLWGGLLSQRYIEEARDPRRGLPLELRAVVPADNRRPQSRRRALAPRRLLCVSLEAHLATLEAHPTRIAS